MITAHNILHSPDPAFLKLMYAHNDPVIIQQFKREYKRAIIKMLINPVSVNYTLMYQDSRGDLYDYRQISPKDLRYYSCAKLFVASDVGDPYHYYMYKGYDITYISNIFGGLELLLFTRSRLLRRGNSTTPCETIQHQYENVSVRCTSNFLPRTTYNTSYFTCELRKGLLYDFFPAMLNMIVEHYCNRPQHNPF